jgi:hypothetical protein
VFYEPQKIELLPLPGSRPASRKIAGTIEPHVEWTRESKILRQMLLKKFPVASCESFVRSLCQTAWADFRHKVLGSFFSDSCFNQFFHQRGWQRVIV